jgi:FlaA1/EpsC-like NDP-sugar epimerase
VGKILKEPFAKRLILMTVDGVLLVCANVIASWVVFRTRSALLNPIVHVNIVGIIFLLLLVQFYRIRISESSLDVIIRSLGSFLPALIIGSFIVGWKHGARSPWIPFLVTADIFGFGAILSVRVSYRLYLSSMSRYQSDQYPRTVIYGAGDLGTTLVRQSKKGKLPFKIVGFVDDNPDYDRSSILGIRVYGSIKDLTQILQEARAKVLIIAITHIEQAKMLEAVDAAKEADCEVKVIPSLFEMQDKPLEEVDVRSLDYADLLGRPLIKIDREPIRQMVQGKTVLVTGAGGSIGQEICRQLLSYGPVKLLLFDIDETELHDLSLRLHHYQREWSDLIFPIVGDIRNKQKVNTVFETYQPQLVFHAAAYKHVPLQELYPEEAVQTNILGSYNVLKAAKEHKAEKVVVISTDKAVNPTNVMGATKRVVELLARMLTSDETEMVSVRFGNVLGSRGSMLPLFVEQIKAGAPVTVTHKDIIRYFMAIPEAVGLVFKAASMAKGGEVMVLDMGQPVKIYDFAKKLVQYYGDENSKIIITGLRPGEKLYEELLADKDTTIPTNDPLVFKAKVNNNIFSEEKFLKEHYDIFASGDKEELLKHLHELVPEFRMHQH